ncbi:2-phospho-L-lactate guanylyltransferase [Leisingera daeponensis]|uniref:2-phospho-L-lactate guanylyltransferase n=1 Tax=Leisingera daeponensis TaxID=405746 RepID=UPI001C93C614|nr:2-phospho-L-lactate guanylyltransferase [Leisingera daeponensis]MBY6058766.1 2-phospho-L-lactate guanylyltransferase [Leisingera daeponensis]
MSELGRIAPVQAWALVPVKPPIWAKTRLSGLLSPSERERLQWAMLADVLDQLETAKWLAGVAVVCPDIRIQMLVNARGLRVFGNEPRAGGMNGAVSYGTERLREAGADLVVVLPGDLPLLSADDIDNAVLRAMQDHRSVIVPDRELEGTNALIFWTDQVPNFQFGKNSFQKHLTDPAVGGMQALTLASIARDIDWPEDLQALRQSRGPDLAPNTKNVLASCTGLSTLDSVEEKT